MPRLERRAHRTPMAAIISLLLALMLTLAAGSLIFAALGKPPIEALAVIFIAPLTTTRGIAELLVKATPLILIAAGLALTFRANVWNIGAEGQYTIGALTGGAVAMAAWPGGGVWLLPCMCLAGALGGAAWAMIPAVLKTQAGVSEVLVSLLLTYVAVLLLTVLLDGPLRDPSGMNFPESRLFQDAARMPLLMAGTRAHFGFVVAVLAAALAEFVLVRHLFGFGIRVLGASPSSARFAGFSGAPIVWSSFAISGALAGLAGVFEAAGPVGQLVPQLPAGYGFSAIIVAFLGRLHPLNCVPAGLVIALISNGGEAAQIAYGLPAAVKIVFQGLLLVFLIGTDVLATHRLRWRTGASWS